MEAPANYTFFLELFSNTIRSCRLREERTPYQIDQLDFRELTQDERDLLCPGGKFLKKIIEEASKKIASRALG